MSTPTDSSPAVKSVTRGEQMLALRKRRMAASPPVLRGGFRPFFLGAAGWGLIALVLWLFSLTGRVRLPTQFEPVAWHRHEMLFGFAGAAVAGFLLTAIPNWTGRLPIAGKPLFALFGLWLSARVALLVSAIVGLVPAAALDVGFFAVLTAVAAREVLGSKNRNVPIVIILLLFTLADAADYAAHAGIIPDVGWQVAIALIIVLISVIGGRIIPSFTRNWMSRQGEKKRLPTQPGALDLLVIAGTALCLLFWVAHPDDRLTGAMMILAAALQLLRCHDDDDPCRDDPRHARTHGARAAGQCADCGSLYLRDPWRDAEGHCLAWGRTVSGPGRDRRYWLEPRPGAVPVGLWPDAVEGARRIKTSVIGIS